MVYRAINWTPNELVGGAKMELLISNADWLFQNTPRSVYTLPTGLRRVEGVKIASGRAIITKRNKDSASVEVRFGNFFSTRCEPNITTGIVSGQSRIHCSINGIGRLVPDHRGFQIQVNVAAEKKKFDKIAKTMFVTWQAMGY